MTRNVIPVRIGEAPVVSGATPHEQLTQNAPLAIQERLFQLAVALPGVLARPSFVCAAGSRALHLAPKFAQGPVSAFLAGTEFAHLHPEYDGSLHIALPLSIIEIARAAGWGTMDKDAKTFLLFGPRDNTELTVAWALVSSAYRFARKLPEVDLILLGKSSSW